MRRFVIGDIHNNYKALKQVIERSSYDYNEDLLIFLGDYVDGYSQAKETIDFLLEIQEKSVNKPIFLMGNHDWWCLNYLKFGKADSIWLANGGKQTYESLNLSKLDTEQIEKYLNFFDRLHYYYIDDDNNAFVHAGYDKGLGKDIKEFYLWDRELWNIALEINNDWKKGGRHEIFTQYKEIFIGHTTTMNWLAKPHYPEYKHNKTGRITVPMNRCNVWNLDTGAGYRGRLTIMDIDSKEYWQSDMAILLYPNESGR